MASLLFSIELIIFAVAAILVVVYLHETGRLKRQKKLQPFRTVLLPKSQQEKPAEAQIPKLDLLMYGNRGIRYRVLRGRGDTVGFVKRGTIKFKLNSKKLIFVELIKGRLYHADINRVQWYKKKVSKFGKKESYMMYPEFVFNSLYSEALKEGQEIPDYSRDVEIAIIDSSADQFIEVGTVLPSFQIDRKMALTMGAIAVLFSFLGLDLNLFLHVVPPTIVHWITTPVKG